MGTHCSLLLLEFYHFLSELFDLFSEHILFFIISLLFIDDFSTDRLKILLSWTIFFYIRELKSSFLLLTFFFLKYMFGSPIVLSENHRPVEDGDLSINRPGVRV